MSDELVGNLAQAIENIHRYQAEVAEGTSTRQAHEASTRLVRGQVG